MNHYCTYFDSGYLSQGLAMWESLRLYDNEAILWVLALDEEVERFLHSLAFDRLRIIPLAKLETDDRDLIEVKKNRNRAEYMFTLSPCWPRWILNAHSEIDGIFYLDADVMFFSSPEAIVAEVRSAGASVGIAAHRYPPGFEAYEKWGRFNVGVQYYLNDELGRDVLEDWRSRCLEWCYDRIEGERFADQKYLDSWPTRFGTAIHVFAGKGINAAPWNWVQYRWTQVAGQIYADADPLVVFHFAKFRQIARTIWDSGQIEFAVMPRLLRNCIYGPYWRALEQSRLRLHQSGAKRATSRLRRRRVGLKAWLLALLFGSVWCRFGRHWMALGCAPLGRKSGLWLNRYRSLR